MKEWRKEEGRARLKKEAVMAMALGMQKPEAR